MIASEFFSTPSIKQLSPQKADDTFLPLELLELELSLDSYAGETQNFAEVVRQAAQKTGGEMLFDLPARGLLEDCQRVAVLRIPAPKNDKRVVLAMLDESGYHIRIQMPDAKSQQLVRLANAFVDVFEKI
ncbi:hypothetical protein [Oryzifoliimicrobium ureilyticus]|uniref:hypothetical protein n=1 Tax=Oryzifoliimicrobium ureilyticus TaxID=3113724 RepID=UPI0030764AE0